jgi:hypothetical protein
VGQCIRADRRADGGFPASDLTMLYTVAPGNATLRRRSPVGLTGRRSGNRYRTPVMVFDTHDGLAIMLPYGLNRDWIRTSPLRAAPACSATARHLL